MRRFRAAPMVACVLASAMVILGGISRAGAGGQPAAGPGGETIILWPEGVPDAIKGGGPEALADGRVSNVHVPTLTAYLPTGARTGTAAIICPGGAYQRLAIEKEGTAVARWLNTLGISAFVLKYRLKEYGLIAKE